MTPFEKRKKEQKGKKWTRQYTPAPKRWMEEKDLVEGPRDKEKNLKEYINLD